MSNYSHPTNNLVFECVVTNERISFTALIRVQDFIERNNGTHECNHNKPTRGVGRCRGAPCPLNPKLLSLNEFVHISPTK